MQKLSKILVIFTTLLYSLNAVAESELNAIELQQYCGEVSKGLTGSEFDKELAASCQGYMSGFFDSMIVIEKVTGNKEFCIPHVLPKTQNNMILSAWINQNKTIAAQTTAAVALYAAFKKAFPCN